MKKLCIWTDFTQRIVSNYCAANATGFIDPILQSPYKFLPRKVKIEPLQWPV